MAESKPPFRHTGTAALFTGRLILRPFTHSDGESMRRNWISDPDIQANYGEPVYETREEVAALLDQWAVLYGSPDFYRWNIVLEQNGESIGQIAFCRVYTPEETAEIEYCIGRSFWGSGYAPEALGAVLKHSFERAGFRRLEAFHRDINTNSGRVLRKCGLTRTDNILRFHLAGERPHGETCYAMTWEDYTRLA